MQAKTIEQRRVSIATSVLQGVGLEFTRSGRQAARVKLIQVAGGKDNVYRFLSKRPHCGVIIAAYICRWLKVPDYPPANPHCPTCQCCNAKAREARETYGL